MSWTYHESEVREGRPYEVTHLYAVKVILMYLKRKLLQHDRSHVPNEMPSLMCKSSERFIVKSIITEHLSLYNEIIAWPHKLRDDSHSHNLSVGLDDA